jgi:hypothetical protein
MIAAQLRGQSRACGRLGSALYGRLLERAAADVQAAGPCWDVFSTYRSESLGADHVLALRLMAAVHRLVLEGRAPELARHYPSVGGDAAGEAWPPFRTTVADNRDLLAERLKLPVQTNEVGRSAALLGGFLLAARHTGLPLRLLELGASAGLNLLWDRYRYVAGEAAWGDPASPVRFLDVVTEGQPPFDVQASVAERRGCDIAPLDPSKAGDRLTLMSYVWADQAPRFDMLARALELAQRTPARVDRADAPQWLADRLAVPAEGVVTVVFHSLVTLHLDWKTRRALRRIIERAGQRATPAAPLAWLRMEWGSDAVEVRLTTWPGAAARLIARTDTAGRRIRLLEE